MDDASILLPPATQASFTQGSCIYEVSNDKQCAFQLLIFATSYLEVGREEYILPSSLQFATTQGFLSDSPSTAYDSTNAYQLISCPGTSITPADQHPLFQINLFLFNQFKGRFHR
eukprot:scaffold3766_cov84-Skeletonema_marinoi.AAC.1